MLDVFDLFSGGPPSAPVPASLVRSASSGLYFDPSRIGSMFQDAAGAVPVTAPGQPVGRLEDLAGRGNNAMQAISASRPIYARHPSSGLRNQAHGAQDVAGAAWQASGVSNGLLWSKVGSGIEGGVPYVDIRFTGTATATEHGIGWSQSNSIIRLTSGSVVASLTARVIAGTAPSGSGTCGIRAHLSERNSSDALIGTFERSSPANGATDSTIVMAKAAVTSGVAAIKMALVVETGGTETVDVTYRIKGLQLELGSGPTALQHNLSQYDVSEPGIDYFYSIVLDGFDDWLNVVAVPWGGSDEVTVVMAIAANPTGVQSGILRGGGLSNPTRFGVIKQSNDLINASSVGTPSPPAAIVHLGAVAGAAEVYSVAAKIGAPSLILRRNGVLSAQTSASQGAGTYITSDMSIGSWGGGQFFSGRLFGLFACNRLLTAPDLLRAERWAARKCGVNF